MTAGYITAAVDELRSNGFLSESTLNSLTADERQLVTDLAGASA